MPAPMPNPTCRAASSGTHFPASAQLRSRRVLSAALILAAGGALLTATPFAPSAAFADLDLTLLSGDRVSGRLDPATEVERHTLECAEGTLVTVSVVSTKVAPAKVPSSLRVRLLDGDGAPLMVASPGGSAAADVTGPRAKFRKVAVPRSGVVVVEVSTPEGAPAVVAGYTLTASLKPRTKWSAPALAVAPEQPGLLTFAATVGSSVRFKAKAPAGVTPTFGRVLENSDPTGTDFTGTAPASAVFVAPRTGTFQLEVLGATAGSVNATASVVVPKTRARKINATEFPSSDSGVLLTLGGPTPADVAPEGDGLDGVRVEIPAGVFPAGTILLVAPAPTVVPSPGFTPAGPAISFSASASFAKGATVTLTLPFDASAANGSTSGVAVTVRDDDGNVSETTSGLNVDLGAGKVSFPASHFSSYQVVVAATPGIISTFAGDGSIGITGDGGPATSASLASPVGVAVSATGVVHISDQSGNVIRAVDALGTITRIAGTGIGNFTGDGGPASAAQLDGPHTIFFDADGRLVVCDRNNNRLRRIDTSGTITTIAGNGTGTFAGDSGTATSASLNSPAGACADAAGNIYIADTFNHRIRRVDTSGTITTVVGNGSASFAGDGAAATAASIRFPTGVAVNAAGDIFIADNGNQRIRRVTPSDGFIGTIAGDGTQGLSGDDGPATAAQLRIPFSVLFDVDGSLLLTEATNHTVRRIRADGVIERVAGTGISGFSGDDGLAVDAQLDFVMCVALDGAGRLYIADGNNRRIRRVTR